MALTSTLEGARNQFTAEINKINIDMTTSQTEVFAQISSEFQAFSIKLKEELNKEREQFQIKYEQDEQAVLEEYRVTSIDAGIGTVLDILADDTNKEAVDELVGQFIEKIEAEAQSKDNLITKGRSTEWQKITKDIQDGQKSRERQIISEIIETTNNFKNQIISKFQQFRDDDEEDR